MNPESSNPLSVLLEVYVTKSLCCIRAFFTHPNSLLIMVFFIHICRALRKLFKVDPADYMISLCGNDALRELSSPGKSGSFFYLTNDDRYMIKTMKKAEVKVSSLLNQVRMFLN